MTQTKATAGLKPVASGGIAAALLIAQSSFPPIERRRVAQAGSRKYRYADLADLLAQCGPILRANQITTTFPTESENGATRLGCRLTHTPSGETTEAWLPLEVAADPKMLGSTITYYRRYLFQNVCGIHSEDDDDGDAASAGAAKRRAGSTSVTRASEPQAGASAHFDTSVPSGSLQRLQKAELHFRTAIFGGDREKSAEVFRRRFGSANFEAITTSHSEEEINFWLNNQATAEAEELRAELKEASDVI